MPWRTTVWLPHLHARRCGRGCKGGRKPVARPATTEANSHQRFQAASSFANVAAAAPCCTVA
eukprot:3996418-Pleurochrysis_carterae.AAC.1